MRAANEQRLASFRKHSRFIKGVRWLGTLDTHCCVICGALDGQGWDLDGNPLGINRFPFRVTPLHPGCRCVLSPIPKSEPATGPTIGARASKDGPLSRGTTFDDFLKRQSPEFIDKMLGEDRTRLFLSGELALRDFVTPDCRERTLAELGALLDGRA